MGEETEMPAWDQVQVRVQRTWQVAVMRWTTASWVESVLSAGATLPVHAKLSTV